MTWKFNPFTGNFDYYASPAGSSNSVQYNASGAFGGFGSYSGGNFNLLGANVIGVTRLEVDEIGPGPAGTTIDGLTQFTNLRGVDNGLGGLEIFKVTNDGNGRTYFGDWASISNSSYAYMDVPLQTFRVNNSRCDFTTISDIEAPGLDYAYQDNYGGWSRYADGWSCQYYIYAQVGGGWSSTPLDTGYFTDDGTSTPYSFDVSWWPVADATQYCVVMATDTWMDSNIGPGPYYFYTAYTFAQMDGDYDLNSGATAIPGTPTLTPTHATKGAYIDKDESKFYGNILVGDRSSIKKSYLNRNLEIWHDITGSITDDYPYTFLNNGQIVQQFGAHYAGTKPLWTMYMKTAGVQGRFSVGQQYLLTASDMFFQIMPGSTSYWGIFETWAGKGMAVSTGTGPIAFTPARSFRGGIGTSGWLCATADPSTTSAEAKLDVRTSETTSIGLMTRGTSGQTADLWQDMVYLKTLVANMDKNGVATFLKFNSVSYEDQEVFYEDDLVSYMTNG